MISPATRSVSAQSTNAAISHATRASVTRIAAESLRGGLIYGTSILGGQLAFKMASPLLVDGATPEGIIGVGVGVVAALGIGLAMTHTKTAIVETRRFIERLTLPSFDGDLAARGAKLLAFGATCAPTLLLASILGGEATPALVAGGFMGAVSAVAGGAAAYVASVRSLREERDAAIPRGGSGVI
ncbi:MAG: hypothetical protein ACAI38_00345 [Myxococcota bacterium]